MNLNPQDARRLAAVLLGGPDAEDEGDDVAAGGGRLSPGPFGRYRITRLVGLGGMGEVYEAQQETPNRRVAIKVVRPDLISGEALRRFEHETRVLAKLQHPGISPIFEAGRVETGSGSTPYFAMEFVDGRPLTAFAAAEKLPVRARLELFLQVCDAVEHAHQKGVIHRDLKPANILVDAAGRPRVMDFGVARATDSDIRATSMHTEVGRLVGTLPYMSPEQVGGGAAGGDAEELDTRSDVYSLGVVLYELLGEKLPYEVKGVGGGRVADAVRAIRESEPAPLSSVDRVFRGDLETIVGKALEKERERRYQSVGELAADIRRYLRDEAIEARRPSGWYQFRKFARRNRGATFVAGLAAAALIVGAAGTGWFALKEHKALVELGTAHQTEVKLRAESEDRRVAAEQSAAVADSVVSFVERVFAAPDLDNHPHDITVSEALRLVAQRQEPFAADKRVDAAIAHTVAVMLDRLGERGLARSMFERALRLREEALGETHEETLRAKLESYDCLLDVEPAPQVLKLIEDLLATAVSVHGVDSRIAIEVLGAKGAVLERLGQVDDAYRLGTDALARAERELGPNDEYTLNLVHNVAGYAWQLAKASEAEALWRRVLRFEEQQGRSESRSALLVRGSLVLLLMDGQRFREAEDELRPLLAAFERVLGPDHPETLTTMYNLGVVLLKNGKLGEAESVARRNLELTSQRLPGQREVLMSKGLLADVLQGREEYAQATVLATEVMDGFRASLGPGHIHTVSAMRKLAAILASGGELERAEELAGESLMLARSLAESRPMMLVQALHQVGTLALKAGAPERGEPALREGTEFANQVLEEGDARIAMLEFAYGRCLLRLSKWKEAEPHLLASLGPNFDPAKLEAVQSLPAERVEELAELYEKTGRTAEAATLRSALAPPVNKP